jgi:hypothetical protein
MALSGVEIREYKFAELTLSITSVLYLRSTWIFITIFKVPIFDPHQTPGRPLEQLGIVRAIAACGFPATRQLSDVQSVLAFLALKLRCA